MRFKGFLLCIIFSLIILDMDAQQSWDGLFQTGRVVKNYPRFPKLENAYLTRISWNQKLNGSKAWHRYYYFPEATVQGVYGSLGNHKELGNIMGLTGGFRFTKDHSYRISFTVEATLGAAYFDHPFDETGNIDNVTIGSNITMQGTADAGVMYHLHPHWSILLKASILHCSNAHFSLPNAGINLPLLSLGFRYRISPATLVNNQEENNITDKKPKLNFRVALGINEQGGTTGPVNGPKYAVYLASAYIYRHYTPVARWQMGLEGYYNNGTYTFITSQRYYTENERWKSTSLLYILGHEYIFGHLGFVTQGGFYLYNPFGKDRYKDLEEPDVRDFLKTLFTARLGANYYFFSTFDRKHKNIFAGCYVKTNFGKADFLELSAGYNF